MRRHLVDGFVQIQPADGVALVQIDQVAADGLVARVAQNFLDAVVDEDDLQLGCVGDGDQIAAELRGAERSLGQSEPLARSNLRRLEREQFVQAQNLAAALGVALLATAEHERKKSGKKTLVANENDDATV